MMLFCLDLCDPAGVIAGGLLCYEVIRLKDYF
jgi:hypothetical protein